jgi:hypothetical protein
MKTPTGAKVKNPVYRGFREPSVTNATLIQEQARTEPTASSMENRHA